MRKLYILGLIAVVALIIGLAWAEQMTFSTYYPAPYGVYNQMAVRTLGVGDNSGDGNITSADVPDPTTDPGDVWINSNIRMGENSDAVIGFNYPDAIRDRRLRITAGKDDLVANAQGACIDLHGNQRPQDTAWGGELHLVAGSAGGPVLFYTGNPVSEAMRVTSAGNVGIGTIEPDRPLHVLSDRSPSPPPAIFERVVPDTSTHTKDAAAVKLTSTGNMANLFGPCLYFKIEDNAGVENNIAYISAYRDGADNSGALGFHTYSSGSPNQRMTIRANGDIGMCGVANYCSDKRSKTNIEDITNALDLVTDMRAVSFNWKESAGMSPERQIGFIGQEMEEVLPEVVTTDQWNGTQDYKFIKYDSIVPVVVEAIKELKAENEAAKARIKVLEAKLAR